MAYSTHLVERLVLPVLAMTTRTKMWPLYREMMELERRSLDDLRIVQAQRLCALLDHANRTVPYYRETWKTNGVAVEDVRDAIDLSRIPPTRKRDIQRAFPDGITSEIGDRSDWRYASTGGTTDRLMPLHDFGKRDVMRAAGIRTSFLTGYRLGERSVEIPPDICNIACGLEGQPIDGVLRHVVETTRRGEWSDPSRVRQLRGILQRGWMYKRRTYAPFGADGTHPSEQVLKDYVDRLREYSPSMVKSLPTFLLQLARFIRRNNLPKVPVDVFKPMGGSVSRVMREQIAAGFTGAYREDYGTAEFGDIACDCELGTGLHIHEDLFAVEIVRGGSVAPAGTLGKILITDLTNAAMPFIRYEVGDVGRISPHACPCGRPGRLLTVEGRLMDTIISAAGVARTNDDFMDFFYSQPEVDDFQLIETEPGTFTLTVVPSTGATPDLSVLTASVQEFLGERVSITARVGARISAEASGKFRFVKSISYTRLDDIPATNTPIRGLQS